jgi:hypothetical protein
MTISEESVEFRPRLGASEFFSKSRTWPAQITASPTSPYAPKRSNIIVARKLFDEQESVMFCAPNDATAPMGAPRCSVLPNDAISSHSEKAQSGATRSGISIENQS